MKYQICYFDRTENNKQILEEFDSYNEFEKSFLEKYNSLRFSVGGVTVYPSDSDTEHELIVLDVETRTLYRFCNKDVKFLIELKGVFEKNLRYKFVDFSRYYKRLSYEN